MELAPLYVREISLDHSSDWINKCMAALGLSVNPRAGPNIVWQENNIYVFAVVRMRPCLIGEEKNSATL